MPRSDLIVPSAQAEGRVSEDAHRLARRIYDPVQDPDGVEGVRRLRKVAAATRSLQNQRGVRYFHFKAANKALPARGRWFKVS
jgi:hypothetical protein